MTVHTQGQTVWQVDEMEHGWASSMDHHVAAAICWSSLYSSEPLISFLLVRLTLRSAGRTLPVSHCCFSFLSIDPPSLCLRSSSPSSDHCSDSQASIVSWGSHTHTKLNYRDGMGRGSEREIGQSACTPPLLEPLTVLAGQESGTGKGTHI